MRTATAIAREDRSGCVQSLVRALSLLDQLRLHPDGLKLTELSRLSELPRSTAHRLLTTLEAMRYVAFDARRSRWIVGLRALAVAPVEFQVDRLAGLIDPLLRALQVTGRATANLALLDDVGLRYVAQARTPDESPLVGRPGDRLRLDASAAGKAALAAMPDDTRRAYLAQMRAGGPGPAQAAVRGLEDALDAVRHCGWATDEDGPRRGVRCVAAAIVDQQGRVHGAISMSCAATSPAAARTAHLGALVREAADDLAASSWRLGVA